MKLELQRLGHCFPGEIVFRRSKAAHEYDDVGTRYGQPSRGGEMLAIVPHNGFENHFHAQLVKFFGEVKGIRILTERSQQLRANGDDLGVHE